MRVTFKPPQSCGGRIGNAVARKNAPPAWRGRRSTSAYAISPSATASLSAANAIRANKRIRAHMPAPFDEITPSVEGASDSKGRSKLLRHHALTALPHLHDRARPAVRQIQREKDGAWQGAVAFGFRVPAGSSWRARPEVLRRSSRAESWSRSRRSDPLRGRSCGLARSSGAPCKGRKP